MKVHFKSIRVYNNMGISFPDCYLGDGPLDLDKTILPSTGDYTKVTCLHCKKRAPKKYPWASFARKKEGWS
jgi:hypothetical protein